jgi:type II secretory ATPase GspE/PulE/Tfp pilus assembly ATPase PilB-like protein
MTGAAPQKGMQTLAENGQLKVKNGITSNEELARVVYLET